MAGENNGKPQNNSSAQSTQKQLGTNKNPNAPGAPKNLASNAAMNAAKKKMGGAGNDMKGAVKNQAINGAKQGADPKEQMKAMGKQMVTKMASKALEATYHVPPKVSEPIIEKVVDKASANPNVDKVIEEASGKFEKVKKKKTLILVMGAIAPIIAPLFGIFMAVAMLLLPLIMVGEFLGNLAEFGDKALNFLTTGSFATSETLFFDTLKDQYDRYNTYNNREGYFDSPLIAATVHYSYAIDPEAYSEPAEESEDDEEFEQSDGDMEYVSSSQAGGFYVWANDQLGSAFTLLPGNKKLIGHMINTKMKVECVRGPTCDPNIDCTEQEINEGTCECNGSFWNLFSASSWDSLAETTKESLVDFANHFLQTAEETTLDSLQVLNFVREIISYWGQGESKTYDAISNLGYEMIDDNAVSEIYQFLSNSEFSGNCPSGYWPIPVLSKYVDYEEYDKYLRTFYIPQKVLHYSGLYESFDDHQKNEIERVLKEIYDQRSAYCDLGHCEGEDVAVIGFTGKVVFPIDISSGRNWNEYVTGYFGTTNGTWVSGHSGIDFGRNVTEGQPIYSIADGTVVWLQDGQSSNIGSKGSLSYGNAMKIGYDVNKDGAYDYYVIYAHMRAVNVSMNENVGGGQKIGELGNTGNSFGAHLHFELRNSSDVPINPADMLDNIFNELPSILNPEEDNSTVT